MGISKFGFGIGAVIRELLWWTAHHDIMYVKTTMELADEIKRDPVAGARRLVAEYRQRLYLTAYRLCGNATDAEDLVFRTLSRAIERIDRFDDKGSFFHWLNSILLNFRLMDVRRKAANMLDFTDELPETSDAAPDAAETLARSEDAASVCSAMESLPELFRQVVVLRYFEDLSIPEMAAMLKIPEGSVKSRLNRAKLRMRRFLSGTIRG